MRELLRRLVLAAGFVAASLSFWYTPVALVGVRVVDWEQDFVRSAKRSHLFPGNALRNRTGPKSAAAYRSAVLEKNALPDLPPLRETWIAELKLPAHLAVDLKGRHRGNLAYFHAEEYPATALIAPLRRKWTETGSLNGYTSDGMTELEFVLVPNPRSSDAPAAVKYPRRRAAYPLALAGVGLYALLGLSLTRGARYDPLPTTVLDLFAATGLAFLVGLPLWLAPSTSDALDNPLGGFVWFGAFGLAPIALLLAMTGRARVRIVAGPDGLQLRRMWSSRFVPWQEVRAIVPPPLDNASTPLHVHLVSGEQLQVPWLGLRDLLPVVEVMRQRGLLVSQPPMN